MPRLRNKRHRSQAEPVPRPASYHPPARHRASPGGGYQVFRDGMSFGDRSAGQSHDAKPHQRMILAAAMAVPSAAVAQAVLTGVVTDGTGGVLPGVTVEARSPSLIEGVRATTTDENGRYRIIDLPSGTYELMLSLPSFATVKRPGVELDGTFAASIDLQMTVGAIESRSQSTAGHADRQHRECQAGRRRPAGRHHGPSHSPRLVLDRDAHARDGHGRQPGHRRADQHQELRQRVHGPRRRRRGGAHHRGSTAGGRPLHRLVV